MTNPNVVCWFEIPVAEMDRALSFYSEVLGTELTVEEFAGTKMAVFPPLGDAAGPVVHGALVEGEGYQPGGAGPIVYLNANPDLSVALGRVADAGGSVLQGKTAIGPHGHMAFIRDTEGNRLALHSDH